MYKKNQKGFTLIELLIVIAIIAILAAIAIPQFAAYRVKGYNASAEADLRNCRTAEEAMFADYRFYGKTDANLNVGVVLPGAGGYGGGNESLGPLSSSTLVNPGALLTTTDSTLAAVGVGIGLGADVYLRGDSDAGAPGGNTYIIIAKQKSGNRVFGGELESSGIYFGEADGAIGQSASASIALCGLTLGAATTGADITTGGGWKSL